jgi:hypothetical protein
LAKEMGRGTDEKECSIIKALRRISPVY